MAAYPTSLATNDLEKVAEVGAIAPSHGGMVQGHEFDLPISQKNSQNAPRTPNGLSAIPPHVLPTPPVAGVTPRRSTSANKPRPVSMPPQAFTSQATDRDRSHGDDGGRHSQRGDGSASRTRSSNRILGDYTLSKTLGAGSMGKVKLAHHNLTGEKVCYVACG